ncbi:MAG: NAD(+)/NADH kinase [Thermoplasmataceae archaeon]
MSHEGAVVAFLINPIAGCGLKYNLKGSDDLNVEQCHDSYSVRLALLFLGMPIVHPDLYLVSEGLMGGSVMKRAGIGNFKVVYSPGTKTTALDTINFARISEDLGADLLVCFGGDGTLRNLCDARIHIPVLAVPAGTKMFSAAFSVNLDDAMARFNGFVESGFMKTAEAGVVDLDEKAYSEGRLIIRPYCTLTVLAGQAPETQSKAEYPPEGSLDAAQYIVDTMEPGVNYLIGPGSSCKNILRLLGIEGSIMGFDLIRDGMVIKSDLSSSEIREVADNGAVRIILSPTGDQGFLLGRGNRQLEPISIKKIGFQNIIIISSREKISRLSRLYCDFQGESVDHPDFVKVLLGYGNWKIIRLQC